jgi:hypothetical protein
MITSEFTAPGIIFFIVPFNMFRALIFNVAAL